MLFGSLQSNNITNDDNTKRACIVYNTIQGSTLPPYLNHYITYNLSSTTPIKVILSVK